MTVFGYCRTATADQASLDDQQRRIEDFAASHNWTICQMFVEKGVSGNSTLASRPAGGEMLHRLQSGDIVMVAKLDRISRVPFDTLKSIDCILQRGARLFVVEMAGELRRQGDVGKLFFSILAAIDEFERNRNRH